MMTRVLSLGVAVEPERPMIWRNDWADIVDGLVSEIFQGLGLKGFGLSLVDELYIHMLPDHPTSSSQKIMRRF